MSQVASSNVSMDAQSRRLAVIPTVPSLAFLQDVIAYAQLSPAALGFWLWSTNTVIDNDLAAAAHARFGIDRDQVALLVAELAALNLIALPDGFAGSTLTVGDRS